MRSRKLYLTGQEKPFIVRNGNKGNAVADVNWGWFPFVVGFILALAIPFLMDWALFGTPTPCSTTKVFEDGSSLQSCEVRG